ncbi:MAG TPA: hypothetical protein VLJ37_06500 [bacterium]|nr:hypothetical protein [bacterium]
MIPFPTPAWAQVTAVQNALSPLTWVMRGKTFAWVQGLRLVEEALADGPPVNRSLLATRNEGEMCCLFRYACDPEGFARMVVKKDEAIGPRFKVVNKDKRNWLKTPPLVIATHAPGEHETVNTQLYLQANVLMPLAGRDKEFFAAEDLTGGTEAFRLVSIFLWAGLGVSLDL